jgi:hypothetical protein
VSVPFALLLAKKYMDMRQSKSREAKTPQATRGGGCGSCSASWAGRGGGLQVRYNNISQEIDNFLKRH